MSNVCCVLLCNKKYFPKFMTTCQQLINNGKYKGDICLVVGDDLQTTINNHKFIINNKIIIKYFPDIKFPDSFYSSMLSLNRPPHWNKKMFQWHKLYLFDVFFKKWEYIFYLDCGIKIFDNIQPIIDCKKENKLLAHSDAYPEYEWKFSNQFDNNHQLHSEYDLNMDYFQTTIMLYDTNIINDNTFTDLYNLSVKYPISKTNDQGIIALYFTNINKLWEQIPLKKEDTYFYDYLSRDKNNKYIMTKL